MSTLRVYKMRANAVIPRYATSGAAGMDLAACLDDSLVIAPGKTARVPTGLKIELPAGHEGQVRPRSGLAARQGVTVLNAPGTIDEDYRGEVQVLLINHGNADFTIKSGDRIAQLIVAQVSRVAIDVVDDETGLGGTERGRGGFGSTGV